MDTVPFNILLVLFCVFENSESSCSTLMCESTGNAYTTCSVSQPGHQLQSMIFKKQISFSFCIKDYSYGFTDSTIWVNKGCRAEFDICLKLLSTVTPAEKSTARASTKDMHMTTEQSTQRATTTDTKQTTEQSTQSARTTNAKLTSEQLIQRASTKTFQMTTEQWTQNERTTDIQLTSKQWTQSGSPKATQITTEQWIHNASTMDTHITPHSPTQCTCPRPCIQIPECTLCQLTNLSSTEIAAYNENLLSEVIDSIKIDKDSTSLAKRKKICVNDDRPSSRIIGLMGVLFSIFPLIIAIVFDIMRCFTNTI